MLNVSMLNIEKISKGLKTSLPGFISTGLNAMEKAKISARLLVLWQILFTFLLTAVTYERNSPTR